MLRIVRDEAFPFIKTLGASTAEIEARDSLSEDHAGITEAFTLILANPLLLPYKFDPSFCKTA
ncbi:MAG: hypothetical protein V7K38_25800 [Nostoc sp.]|uniref:hypothetical protein n=1 Tax=Nostoc sp. TaxID=1180 RepID=UPI002FF9D83A